MKLSRALDRLTPVVGAIALLSLAPNGFAQSQELQKVEVTASKRTQLVIDVPYSITAIRGSEIADRGVTDIQQIIGRIAPACSPRSITSFFA
jgi:outer membrane receptor for ferrienterochelin and colicin